MRYEDYRRKKNARQARGRSNVTAVLAVVVIIAALIAIAVVIISLIPKNAAPPAGQQTASETAQPTLYIPDRQDAGTPTAPPATAAPQSPADNAPTAPDATSAPDAPYADDPTEPDVDTPIAPADTPASGTSIEADGALHYFASGGTSDGYNWTYSSDGVIVDITCKYLFDSGQYDFIITGVTPGETSFTLVYYTDDTHSVNVPMTVSVDDSLKVTRIY